MGNKKKYKSVKDFTKTDFIDKESRIANTKIADELAVSHGYKNARQFMDSTIADINSPSKVKSKNAKLLARQFTQDLLLLVLYQHIEEMSTIKYVEYFSNMFDDGAMPDGNTKQYIQPLDMGADEFVDNAFIPDGVTEQSVETARIDMYKSNNVLSDNAYQFKKPLTIQEPLWYPYFMSGKLSDYVAQITAMMMRTYTYFKFDKLATFLTNIAPKKVITGTQTDIFRIWADEIIPEIEKMTLLNNDYNINPTSKYISTVDKDNLLIILPVGHLARMRAGVLSQLYNAKYLSVEDNYLSENIITLGNKINVPASTGLVSVDSTNPYVPETRVIVIDKRAIRSLIQVNRNESQSWAENMSIQLTLHCWGVFGLLGWYKMFIYNNPNLQVLPSAKTEGGVTIVENTGNVADSPTEVQADNSEILPDSN